MPTLIHRTLPLGLSILLGVFAAAGQELELKIPPVEEAEPQQENAEAFASTAAEAPEERLILPAETQIPLELQNTINTRNSRAGDRIYFETIYPIILDGRIVIPVGSYVRGSVARVKRPGRIKGRAELHIRFDELTLPNGYTVDLNASLTGAGSTGGEKLDRKEGGIKGEGTKGEDAGTITGTAVDGAILGGAITRSGAGVQSGAGIGAAIGLATVLLTRGKELILERGPTVEITLGRPLPLDPELASFDWTDYSSRRRERR